MVSGHPALGAVIKNAKEQLRALPDPLTFGLLRYLNPDANLRGADPTIGFNYLGRQGRAAALSEALWRPGPQDWTGAGAASEIPMPLPHTVELNAVTVETDGGPVLYANWTWATSVLDHGQICRLSRLWFEALAGICAHVRSGGGGLTPSDIVPARLSQHQIDELGDHRQIADILALTPVQQGLLFHASTVAGSADLYAGQLDFALTGPLDVDRLRDAVQTMITRHPHLLARFCGQFEEPVQIIPAEPVVPWRYVEVDGDTDEPIDRFCAAERAAVCDLGNRPPLPGGADPHGGRSASSRADQSPYCARRVVTTNPVGGDIRRLLQTTAVRSRSVPRVCQLAG